jgi:hypothetical protein
MNQTNVQQAHLNGSGFLVLGRNRIKGISFTGTSSAGFLALFDTTTAPITTATYGRSGNTVTITQSAHGFVTGQVIGIDFAAGTGGTATNGNYVVTVTNSSTFTVTDINSGTITGSPGLVYANRWLLSYDVSATDIFNNSPVIADDGVLAVNGIYAYLSNVTACNIYYG